LAPHSINTCNELIAYKTELSMFGMRKLKSKGDNSILIAKCWSLTSQGNNKSVMDRKTNEQLTTQHAQLIK